MAQKDWNKKYYEANKEKRRLAYEANKEVFKEKSKQYREANKEKVQAREKLYKQNNKEKINEYHKTRAKNDPLFKLGRNLRCRINQSIKERGFKKLTKAEQILGCSYQEFKDYLENKFEPWMSWDNYGNPEDGILKEDKSWDIDHIIPLSSATNEYELLQLNHYSNLQPLCSYINRNVKKNNVPIN